MLCRFETSYAKVRAVQLVLLGLVTAQMEEPRLDLYHLVALSKATEKKAFLSTGRGKVAYNLDVRLAADALVLVFLPLGVIDDLRNRDEMNRPRSKTADTRIIFK